ncbi:hypothetical protein AMR72_15230 [Flavobacterium psychrophilum]|nr:hypothetical protein AMR72_15230 [Flavobacterium psychrophilum]AOE53747.1 hypothetical protein ALW18_15220 [Flavobacterium psychrophilum]
MNAEEVSRVYDTLLSAPGMEDEVRVDIRIARKHLLLLNHILGLPGLTTASELLKHIDATFFENMKELGERFLDKASLTAFNAKFISVNNPGPKS